MRIDAPRLLLLLNWMSPAFPTGAFAYSHGLEWAIDAGDIASADDVRCWISDILTRGSGWNDAVIFARCWDDDPGELNELALALASSQERYLETTQIGRAFAIAASVFNTCHPRACPGDDREILDDLAYPIAAGTACASAGVEKSHALLAYLQGFCAALTSVAVRLVPIGQTAGLEVLRDLMPVIAATAQRAANATLDDLGSSCIGADIAAMRHETLETRVFRT